jgi:hypothetical protein
LRADRCAVASLGDLGAAVDLYEGDEIYLLGSADEQVWELVGRGFHSRWRQPRFEMVFGREPAYQHWQIKPAAWFWSLSYGDLEELT